MFGEDVEIPFSDAFEKTKIVSIDYDETFNLNPILFLKIIDLFKKSGFKVICCTFRSESERDEGFDILENNNVKCYFTNQVSKNEYLKSKGINVGIWIDDDPYSIV